MNFRVGLLTLFLFIGDSFAEAPKASSDKEEVNMQGTVEVLQNTGFEVPFGENGMPPGWRDRSAWADLDVEYSWVTDHPYSGRACLKIDCIHFSDGAVQLVQTPKLSIQTGKIYRASAWMRSGVEKTISVMIRKEDSPWTTVYAQSTKRIHPGSGWQLIDFIFTSEADDSDVYLMIRSSAAGVFYLDDLSFEELSVEQAKAFANPPQKGNLLTNGSFELDQSGWILTRCPFEGPTPEIKIESYGQGQCLRIDVPEEGKHTFFQLTSTLVPVSTLRPVTISCRIRASRPVKVKLDTVSGVVDTEQTIGIEWQTITATGNYDSFPPDQMDSVRISTKDHPVTIWIDDVQLRQDGQKTGNDRFNAAIITERYPLGLHHDGDDIKLRLMSHAPEGVQPQEINWRVFDFWDNEVQSGKWLPETGRQEKVEAFDNLSRGWYRAEMQWQEDGKPRYNESTFVLLPPAERKGSADRSPFGSHFASPDAMAVHKAIGARWVRMNCPILTKWKHVEPEKGKWTWPDEQVKAFKDAGFEILGSLDRIPDWAARDPDVQHHSGAYFFGSSGQLPADWADWENYVERIVTRYKGIIDRWEIGNEMNTYGWLIPPEGMTQSQGYYELLKHTYPIVKKANPAATVVGIAVSGEMKPTDDHVWGFVNGVLDLGGWKYMDVFSYHTYWTFGAVDERTTNRISDWVPRLRARMREVGGEKPVVCTEGGFNNADTSLKYRPIAPSEGPSVPASDMAKYLVRLYLAQWHAGVDRFYFYTGEISGSPKTEPYYGLVESGGQPLPNVAAYAAMTWLLDEAVPLKDSALKQSGSDVWVYPFTTPRGILLVACAKTGTTFPFKLDNAVGCWDLMGVEQKLPDKGQFTLADSPTYILLKDQ